MLSGTQKIYVVVLLISPIFFKETRLPERRKFVPLCHNEALRGSRSNSSSITTATLDIVLLRKHYGSSGSHYTDNSKLNSSCYTDAKITLY